MSLFSIVAALLLEQLRPLEGRSRIYLPFVRYANALERHLNGGAHRHGVAAWLAAVLPPALLALGGYLLLYRLNPLLAWLWNILLLYLTMGFRKFSHFFTGISDALAAGDLPTARRLLGEWRGEGAELLDESTVARVSIEHALVASHRHVFGVVFWFLLLPGPAGALLYRLAWMLDQKWGAHEGDDAQFGAFSRRAFALIDWLPSRVLALSFAAVGDFQDALDCWRDQAAAWGRGEEGIVLASGAGALGVRLGSPLPRPGEILYRPDLGVGDDADVQHMQAVVGLLWRALVLWLALVAVVTLAGWLG